MHMLDIYLGSNGIETNYQPDEKVSSANNPFLTETRGPLFIQKFQVIKPNNLKKCKLPNIPDKMCRKMLVELMGYTACSPFLRSGEKDPLKQPLNLEEALEMVEKVNEKQKQRLLLENDALEKIRKSTNNKRKTGHSNRRRKMQLNIDLSKRKAYNKARQNRRKLNKQLQSIESGL